MGWQRLIADVGGELLDDGRPAYTSVWISVPRQNGKTTLILAWEIDRCLWFDPIQRVIYSAQTGKDARSKLLEDQWPMIEHSSLRPAFLTPLQSMGSEAIRFKNGSRISVMASDEGSGHGKTIGLGVIDEAFRDTDSRREQALRPAMRTVRDAQLLVASTMGTDASTYLNRLVETGREAAAADREDSRVAYFEWSAPDDADIEDPSVWAACTPALGQTVDVDTIRAEFEANRQTPGDFQRFALNMRTASSERIIPEQVWKKVCNEFVVPDGRLVFGIDCDPDRAGASIARADRSGRVELLEKDSGTGWILPTVTQLAQKWAAPIAVDPGGPAAFLIPDLERQGLRVVEVGGKDFSRACGLFYTAVADGEIQVRSDGRLDLALAAAKKREVGDAWAFARKSSSSDISPLVAVTVAFWAANQQPGASKFVDLDEI
jgi:hypothetical protein